MVGAQLMTMMLVVGIGQTFIVDLINLMSAEVVMKELGVILIATLVLYGLANKVPTMVSSIVTGHINTGPYWASRNGCIAGRCRNSGSGRQPSRPSGYIDSTINVRWCYGTSSSHEEFKRREPNCFQHVIHVRK